MKTYIKPETEVMKVHIESLLQQTSVGFGGNSVEDAGEDEGLGKRSHFNIFDNAEESGSDSDDDQKW